MWTRIVGGLVLLIGATFGIQWLFPRTRVFGAHREAWADPDVPRRVDYVQGSCLLLTRGALAALLHELLTLLQHIRVFLGPLFRIAQILVRFIDDHKAIGMRFRRVTLDQFDIRSLDLFFTGALAQVQNRIRIFRRHSVTCTGAKFPGNGSLVFEPTGKPILPIDPNSG